METSQHWTVVFQSAAPRACDDRAFVLLAIGIPATKRFDAGLYSLCVEPANAARAVAELASYAVENRPSPPPAPLRLHGGAIASAVAFAVVLFALGVAASRSLGGFDWYAAGSLDGAAVRAGEWWRATTALTLHADLAHLLANAGFGALFGGLAARVYGAGIGWALVLAAATLANLLNAAWMPPGRESIGASTAVFAALGALALHRWPAATPRRRAGIRGASVIAALVLLALLGTGDAHTDILAHALGFGCGALLAATLRGGRIGNPNAQLGAAAFSLGWIGAAWIAALAAGAIR